MPTYEYECERCEHRFDVFHRMSDPPPEACPRCGGPVHKRVGAGVGVLRSRGGGSGRGPGECDRSSPCCGRPEPCDKRPCD